MESGRQADACGEEADLARLLAARAVDRDDIELARECGRRLARLRRFDESLAIWREVERLYPADEEAAFTIARLTIDRSRHLTALVPDADLPPRSALADETLLQSLLRLQAESPPEIKLPAAPAGSARLRQTPIQQLEAAIREQPTIPDYYLQLAPLYLDNDRDYDAERLLAKGKAETGDPRVRELWEDVVMLRLAQKLATAEQNVELDDVPETRAVLAEVLTDRDHLEIQIFTDRAERSPNDGAVQHQLGLRLRRAGKLRDACHRFAEALHAPGVRCAADLQLAECQQQLGQLPVALQNYRLAAASPAVQEDLELKKRAIYQAGQLAERLKLNRLAAWYYHDLQRIDPDYRDVETLLAGMG
jgi:tetratricopeptide (TPR) repeat protein